MNSQGPLVFEHDSLSEGGSIKIPAYKYGGRGCTSKKLQCQTVPRVRQFARTSKTPLHQNALSYSEHAASVPQLLTWPNAEGHRDVLVRRLFLIVCRSAAAMASGTSTALEEKCITRLYETTRRFSRLRALY